MHASIRRYKVNTDAVAALAVRVEDGFIPIISRLPGFVSYMVVDGGDGIVASISIFESEESAKQSNTAAAAWVQENLSDVITEVPEITAGEIALAAPTPPAWCRRASAKLTAWWHWLKRTLACNGPSFLLRQAPGGIPTGQSRDFGISHVEQSLGGQCGTAAGTAQEVKTGLQ